MGHCYQLLAQRDVDLLSSARGEIDASEFLVPVLGSNRFFAGSYSLPSVGVTRQAIGRSSSG